MSHHNQKKNATILVLYHIFCPCTLSDPTAHTNHKLSIETWGDFFVCVLWDKSEVHYSVWSCSTGNCVPAKTLGWPSTDSDHLTSAVHNMSSFCCALISEQHSESTHWKRNLTVFRPPNVWDHTNNNDKRLLHFMTFLTSYCRILFLETMRCLKQWEMKCIPLLCGFVESEQSNKSEAAPSSVNILSW